MRHIWGRRATGVACRARSPGRRSAWDKAGIAQAIKDTLAEQKLKMPQLAIPLRVAVCGRTQTPSIDAVLALFDRATVMQRLSDALRLMRQAGRRLKDPYNRGLARGALP